MSEENTVIEGADPQEPRPLTYGEKAVGVTFNPAANPTVNDIKNHCANLVDYFNNLRGTTESVEQKRMLSIAITELQTAQMWAVKAVTWQD